jgi:polar amino acid transport system ATP-binding protein
VIVTHEMGFACQACEKTAFLYNGRIREYGESKIMFNKPETAQLQTFLNKLLIWN